MIIAIKSKNRNSETDPPRKDRLAEDFFSYLAVERNASPRTLSAYRCALEDFRAGANRPWKQCNADHFRDYLFSLMKRDRRALISDCNFPRCEAFIGFWSSEKASRAIPLRELQLPKAEAETAASTDARANR